MLTGNAQTVSPPPHHRRRRLRAAAVIALAIAAACTRFAWLRITREPTPRPEYWQARLAELDPPPPGAIPATEARDLLEDRPWETHRALTSFSRFDPLDLLAGTWDPARPAVAAAHKVFRSDDFTRARDRMRRAALQGWSLPCSLPYPFLLDRSPSQYRAWARWLVAHSRWARQAQGDTAAAIEDWLTTLRLARQLERSRMSIPFLVGSAMKDLVALEMMAAAREPPFPPDPAGLARQVREILGPPLPVGHMLAGERVYLHNAIDARFVRQGGDWLVVSEAARETATARRGGTSVTVSRAWNLLSPLYDDIETARRRVDWFFAWLDHCSNIATYMILSGRTTPASPPETPNALCGLNNDEGPGWYADMLRVASFEYEARCHLEAAATMLALAEYRRRTGRYPDRLEQLLPEYLPTLPIDPVDGQPLRYRPHNGDYVLYSIGLDGKDDGGRSGPKPASVAWFRDHNPDVVFSRAQRAEPNP